MQRPLLIVDPASGGGRTRARLPALQRALLRHGIDGDVAVTRRRWDAYHLAASAISRGRTCLVACGGDGTVYEVANAVIDSGRAADVVLGTVGLGTGKDVARCLGMPTPAAGLRAVAAGHERLIDVGRIELHDEHGAPVVRHFLLEASAGWVPEISQSTPTLLKRLGDTAPYVIMTVVKMAGPIAREFEVTIDGSAYHGRYNSVSVHNMEYWGGDLRAVPGSSPEDGVLDAVRWGAVGRRTILEAVRRMRTGGTHLELQGIDHHPATQVALASPRRTLVDLDGELGGFLPARITVVPRALRFLAPA